MQPAADLLTLEPIRDTVELMDPPEHPVILWSVGIALVLLLALALWLAIRWFLRRRRVRLASPERFASERLWRIEPDAMSTRELFRQLHPILIEYLDARAGIAASLLTSPEIVASFHDTGFPESPELQAFLTDSDRARFSASPAASSSPGRDSVRQCHAIIEKVETGRKRNMRRHHAI